MEKRHIQLLTLVILGLFLFSSITLISAKPVFVEQLEDSISGVPGFFRDVVVKGLEALGFEDLGDGRLETSRFLLMLITVMLVYSVLGTLGLFGEKPWINWVVSVAAGFLGFLFIPSGTIRAIALEYEIMAVLLNIILPVAIVLMFTWQIQTKVWSGDKSNVNPIFAIYLSKIIVGSMAIYLFFQALGGNLDIKYGVWATTIAWILLLLLIIYFFFSRKIIDVFLASQEKIQDKIGGAKALRRRIEKLQIRETELEDLVKLADRNNNKTKADRYTKEYVELNDKIKKLQSRFSRN